MTSGAEGPPPDDFRLEVRIFFEDTDSGGVTYYANYLKFFERARTEWLRSLGVSQQRLRLEQGAQFVVSRSEVDYLMPAMLDDLLQVTVRVEQAGRASLLMSQEAWRGAQLLSRGRVRIGCVDVHSLRPCRIPQEVVQAIAAATGSAPMTN